jgi:UDP-N-acetylmuramoyl-tripeptide--D-alanyl-D-alanine ligase
LGNVVASEASYNNDVGVPATLLRLDSGTRAAVVEVGTNHPGELRPLLEMASPTAGILTSLGREHLEFFGDLSGVIEEEGTLAEVLGPEATLVVNGDSEGVQAVVDRARGRVLRCGESAGNDWRITQVEADTHGSRFQIKITGDGKPHEYQGEFRVNVVGRHMVVNAVLALAMASVLGVPASLVRNGLESCRPARMRMNLHDFGGVRVIDDAYNANPDSMLAALRTLNDLPCAGRRVAVLGQMAELGPHSETAHEEVGRAAALWGVERLVAVGRHAERMVEAARKASLKECLAFPDATAAAAATLQVLRPGDTVLVKASRSTRLETVVEHLRQSLSTPAQPGLTPQPH